MSTIIHNQSATVYFAGLGGDRSTQLSGLPKAYTLLQWALRPYYDDPTTKDSAKRKVRACLRVEVDGSPVEILREEWLVNTAVKPKLDNSEYAVKVASEAFGFDLKEDIIEYLNGDELTEEFGVFEVKLTLDIVKID
tara:strand:+ start:6319 stop:6729 length:411 start_codon:yes stop_codon:yes gene_type:complete